MEELQPQELEGLVRELEEESEQTATQDEDNQARVSICGVG